MSEEETLALDAMRADNIIDLETRQQYEAIHDAAMGDWMSTEDEGPKLITGYKIFGQNAVVEPLGVPGVDIPDVGASPTSDPQKLLNELQGIVDDMVEGVTRGYGRALDILHELSELFLNQK